MGVGEVPVLDGSIVQRNFVGAARPAREYFTFPRPRYRFAVSSLIVIFLATDFMGRPVA